MDESSTSQDLNAFINSDAENLDRFEQFLEQEGLKLQLEFCLAVRGLKSEPIQHLGQIIRTIYKHYFDIVHISDSVRSSVRARVTTRDYSIDIFDSALDQVWEFLDTIVYKEFLNHVNNSASTPPPLPLHPNYNNNNNNNNVNSESCHSSSNSSSFLPASAFAADQISIASVISTVGNNNRQVQQQQISIPQSCSSSSSSSTCSTSVSSSSIIPPKNLVSSSSLEPLIEGQELRQPLLLPPPPPPLTAQNNPSSCPILSSSSSLLNPIVGLTRAALLATQKERCSGVDCMPLSLTSKQKPKFPYHYANYNSYNPVSRVDSEVQSFSSGCLTDSECGEVRSRKERKKKEELNCDNLPSLRLHIKDSKEMRCPKKNGDMDPQTFANVLIQKLQEVKRKRDAEEQMNKRLSEEITQALRDKLFVSNEVQPDDILDSHVSRVWSDVTPPSSRYKSRNKNNSINPGLRTRIHNNKEQEHQIPKSRSFPSGEKSKYNDDSGISIMTTSTAPDLTPDLAQWIRDSSNMSMNNNNGGSSSKPNSKSNGSKLKRKEISCVVQYPSGHPYYYKMPTSGGAVTLNLFKDFLPKKGLYRYFFKYSGHDGVVREEVKNDSDVIPMFDDKIVAYLRDS